MQISKQYIKNFVLIFLFQVITIFTFSQKVNDYKIKNSKNVSERKAILDLARKDILKDIHQDVIFKVKHLKVFNNYAWFEADASRMDRKPLQFPDDLYDCCHVEGLFKKVKGKWIIVEFNSFSTDCWYCGIALRFPQAPRIIFSEAALLQ